MESATYVILGNSAAAIHAVEAIREADAFGTILLVARESQHVYSRPLISYRLAGKVDDTRMDYRKRDWYQQHKVKALLGVEAVKIDAKARTVEVSPSSNSAERQAVPMVIGFEKLLIATGGAPIRPPIAGLDAKGVFTFTTWDDELAIAEYIEAHKVRHAVVLGGGLIGLKTVEALVDRAVPTTVVELADRLLAVTFDPTAARLAAASLAEQNVTIRTNTTIKEVEADKGVLRGVTLSDGQRVECDLLVVAIGVRPDLSLVAGSGVKADRGIVVDERQATNVEGIYAAGDVAQVVDALSGASRPVPILPAASRQGRIAGPAPAHEQPRGQRLGFPQHHPHPGRGGARHRQGRAGQPLCGG